jgi:hypothetical protein
MRGHTILNDEENFKHDLITKRDGVVFYLTGA